MKSIFTGLGSCTGTGLISGVLEMLLEENKNFVGICSLPFYREGSAETNMLKERITNLNTCQVFKTCQVFFFGNFRSTKSNVG